MSVVIVVEIPPTNATRNFNLIYFDSTVFCAELLAHPLYIVIPYCPVDGKCLFSKNKKPRQFQKNVDPHHVAVHTITTGFAFFYFCKQPLFLNFAIPVWLRTQYLSDVQVFWHNKQALMLKILKYYDQPVQQRCHSRQSLIPWPLRTHPPSFLPSSASVMSRLKYLFSALLSPTSPNKYSSFRNSAHVYVCRATEATTV